MKRVIVTPVTQAKLAQLLCAYLADQKQAFDEWHLWINTEDAKELEGIASLASSCDWITCVAPEGSNPQAGRLNLWRFHAGCTEAGSAYLRLDEDIVWLHPAFVQTLFEFRESSPAFLVHANVVNNAFLARVHERLGLVPSAASVSAAAFAEAAHSRVLAGIEAGDTGDWTFARWRLWQGEAVPLDAVAWLGAEFQAFEGRVPMDYEAWLCGERPARIGKENVVCGRALCVKHGHAGEAVLDRYLALIVKTEPDVVTTPPAPPPQEPPPPPAAPRKRRASTRKTTV